MAHSSMNGQTAWPMESLLSMERELGRLRGVQETSFVMHGERFDRTEARLTRIEDRIEAVESSSELQHHLPMPPVAPLYIPAAPSPASTTSWTTKIWSVLPPLSARHWWAVGLLSGAGLVNMTDRTIANGIFRKIIDILLGS